MTAKAASANQPSISGHVLGPDFVGFAGTCFFRAHSTASSASWPKCWGGWGVSHRVAAAHLVARSLRPSAFECS